MKNLFKICMLMSLLLMGSCQSESGSEKSKSKSLVVDESAIDVEVVKQVEIKNIKEQLNSGDYSLSISELDDLKSEGLLTDDEYQELTQITQN